MCRKCCGPQRSATIEELEAILREEGNPDRRATAYAALTLTRLLDVNWTHVVPVKDGKTVRYETVTKPAGEIFGDREEIRQHLSKLCWELR
jgi:hypothetical protein